MFPMYPLPSFKDFDIKLGEKNLTKLLKEHQKKLQVLEKEKN